MSSFYIRGARIADRVAIGALWRELMNRHRLLDPRFHKVPDGEKHYVRHVTEMIRSRNARVLVAEDIATGNVVAYLMAELQIRPAIALPGTYGFISDICVQEEWQQRGVGTALFTEIRKWFVEQKAQAIELYVAEENPVSTAFWKSMGFDPFLKLMHLDL